MERSLRARFTLRRDAALSRADLLYAEGCAVAGLVQPYFAGKSSGAELHWTRRRDYRRNLLLIHWCGSVPFRGHSARVRRSKTVSSRIAGRAAVGLDRSLYHIGCLFAACAAVSFAGLERRLQHSRTGGWIGYVFADEHRGLLRNALGPLGSLLLLIGIYVTTLILVTGLRPIHLVRETVALMRRASVSLQEWRLRRQAAQIRSQGATGDQRTAAGQAAAITRKAIKEERRARGELTGPMISPEELANRPKPKVVDTTALPSEQETRRKPSLAELRASEQKGRSTPSVMTPAWTSENYVLPGIDLLDEHSLEGRGTADPSELEDVQQVLIETLGQFGIAVAPGDITKGPTITRYEVYPAKGVRVDKIVSLERDLARATRAERINILAPIPGKDTVGIELANSRKVTVKLRELLQSSDWEEAKGHTKIPLALGKDVYGKTIIADLAQMPHLLVAGTTGSGKSVCINALIASMLFRFTPEELRLIIIDPKMVELQQYSSLPHLAFPIVVDPKKVMLALRWLIDEMERGTEFLPVSACATSSVSTRDRQSL